MGHLVIVRHGESTWNSENKYTGWTDIPLSTLGEREAANAGKLLSHFNFDKAYTSKLKRARTTLEIILASARNPAPPITDSESLNERNFGVLEGWEKNEAVKHFGQEAMDRWLKSFEFAPPGGETLEETFMRTHQFFEAEVLPDLKRDKNVILVAHGNVLRTLITVLEQKDHNHFDAIEVPTATPRIYGFSTASESFRITGLPDATYEKRF